MPKVLLADDEAFIRSLVRKILDAEYQVLEASDGPSTLRMAAEERPDVIVLDWTMPGMTGLEVAEALARDPMTACIPVIMLTGRDLEEERENAAAVGVFAFLGKPFSPLELLRVIKRAEARQATVVSPTARMQEGGAGNSDAQLALYARDLRITLDAERRRAAELADAHARLQQLDRLKTDFLGFVSHELRTPLNAMSVIGMFDQSHAAKDQLELIEIAKSGYERLEDFVKRGLECFQWLAVDRLEIQDACDLGRIVRRVADSIPRLANSRGLRFKVPPSSAERRVVGKEQDIARVTQILIENAVNFSAPDTPITAQLSAVDGWIVLQVTNEGRGFPPEFGKELFRPFTIGDVLHHSRGTGLSLAIAKAIVAAHGGRIRGESAGSGRGATFSIELPAATELVPTSAN
jgi:two-component system, sensor histidine kinase and response regulator